MREIETLPWNGFNVVSTFSGCGGSCLGYRMAGYRVRWASEFIPAAQACYQLNHRASILDTRDVRQVQPEEILEAIGLKAGELDLLDGSPPCASFSTAGKRSAGWGQVKAYSDTKQRTDDLFFEYARILEGLRPKVFVAENVSGLVKGVAKGYFLLILKRLKECGYRVQAKVLDAQWLGVPQMRQRLIFVGVREDLGREPAFPKPLPYRYSVREAVPWILRQGDNGEFGHGSMRDASMQPDGCIGTGPNTGNGRFPPSVVEAERIVGIEDANGYTEHAFYAPDRPMDTIQAQRPRSVAVVTAKGSRSVEEPAPALLTHGREHTTSEMMLEGYAVGREWDKLKPGEQSERYFQMVKADPGLPCPTVTQRGGDNTTASVVHPTEKRKFSIAELKRICAFPDDFQLTGTYAQQWERLGRAVPPVMMQAIAATIRDEILCKL